jgi:D-alanyl-D-alanine carboxypeptidase
VSLRGRAGRRTWLAAVPLAVATAVVTGLGPAAATDTATTGTTTADAVTSTTSTTTDPSTTTTSDPSTTSDTSTTSSTSPEPTTTSSSSSTSSSPAPTTTSSPKSTSTPKSTVAPPVHRDEQALSPTQLQSQIAQAEALRLEILHTNATIAHALSQLELASEKSNGLLQAYNQAKEQEKQAAKDAAAATLVADQLDTQLEADHRRLGYWAYHAYAGGGGLAESVTLFDAMVQDASQAGDAAGDLAYLTDERLRAFQRTRLTAEDKKALADQAVAAQQQARDAATAADEAKRKLDGAMKAQKKDLLKVRALYLDQVQRAGPIAGILMGQNSTAAKAAYEALMAAIRSSSGLLVTGSGKPCSGDESDYPNGAIPISALCPLWGAPGEYLRPTAAAAFSAMSKAYARDTGKPLCVTDSYRTYAEQVALKAEKGKWAATPGTSEHGLGKAVDLCGGVENFGTAAHLWMKANAPLFGWFHPDWAEPNGPLPEPWHWEFAG